VDTGFRPFDWSCRFFRWSSIFDLNGREAGDGSLQNVRGEWEITAEMFERSDIKAMLIEQIKKVDDTKS